MAIQEPIRACAVEQDRGLHRQPVGGRGRPPSAGPAADGQQASTISAPAEAEATSRAPRGSAGDDGGRRVGLGMAHEDSA